VKGVIAYLQNDADIFNINSSYIFVSHSWCLRNNKNENKLFKVLGCLGRVDIFIITYIISYINLIFSIPLCTYNNFIKLYRLYTTNK